MASDPEVLDRNAIMLSALPPALHTEHQNFANARCVAFGRRLHHRLHPRGCDLVIPTRTIWAQLLGDVSGNRRQIAHRNNPAGFRAFFQVIAEAWQHGRTTPSMMAIEWEQQFNQPIDEIRPVSALRLSSPGYRPT